MARKEALLMERLLAKLTQEQIAPIVQYLDEQVTVKLVNDVSSYAVGRQRIWLPYEAPLSNNRDWQLGIDDPKLWQWICQICKSHAGFTPDVALVAKGGQIKPHRDTSYADYKAIGINLGPVTWGYQRQRTAYANMPQDHSAEKVEIQLQGGEVFEFNSKNVHWTRNAHPNRWSINAWTVKAGVEKQKFETFLENLKVSEHNKENLGDVVCLQSDKKGSTMSSDPFYVMGTGSRSLVIEPKEIRMEMKAKLILEIEKLKTRYPGLVLISGMAEGWDELIARVAVEVGVPFVAMVPNKDYGSYYWGRNSLLKKDRIASFKNLLSKAQKVIYLEEIYGRQINLTKIFVDSMKAQGKYAATCLPGPNFIIEGRLTHANFARNQAMVDMCHGALVYQSESPGTKDTVTRLKKANKPYKVASVHF